MDIDLQIRAHRPRLNPFVFPSETDFRFVLLIVAVLGASMFIFNWLYWDVPGNEEHYSRTVLECRSVAQAAHPTDPFASNILFQRCRAPVERANALWIILGATVLVIASGSIYLTYPAWKIRRDHLVPISPEDAPEVVAYLAELCREAGLSRPPIFVWNPLNLTCSGVAFGRFGRYYVALTGGLVTQFYSARPTFRAVVLHEFAHLRNADINKTYIAVAVWQAFIIVALVPFVVSLFVTNSLDDILNMSWRVLALAALVYITRNAVLRAREVYADVRTSVWDGPASALGRAIEALPRPKGGRWRSVFQVHPDPSERRRALDNTDRLFRMGLWEAFGTGIATTIALPSVVAVLMSLLTGTQSTLHAQFAAALIFAPLAVGVVGLGIWRGTFAAMARGEVSRGAGRLGIALGLGFIVGQHFSFTSAVRGQSSSFVDFGLPLGVTELSGSALVAFNILWYALLVGSLFLSLRWIAAGASAWLEVGVTGRSPRPTCWLGLAIAGGLLAVWLGFLFSAYDLKAIIPLLLSSFNGILGAIWIVVVNPLTSLALLSLWAFPLATWFWRGRVALASGSSWVFLDSASEHPTIPHQLPLRPGFALLVGLAGGAAFCGLLLVIRILLRLEFPEVTKNSEQFRLMFFIGQVTLAALMQVGVAAIVASRLRRFGALHGLLAAFIGGSVMTIGVLLLNLLFGGTIDGGFAWYTFSQVVNGGALLALPVALCVSVLAGWVRRSGTLRGGQ